MTDVCDILGITCRAFAAARRADPDYQRRFIEAREEGFERMSEKMVRDAKEEPDVARLREMNIATRWHMAKMNPARWGDQVKVQHEVGPSLAEAIAEGVARCTPVTQVLPSSIDAGRVLELKRVGESHALDAASVPTFAAEPDDQDRIP